LRVSPARHETLLDGLNLAILAEKLLGDQLVNIESYELAFLVDKADSGASLLVPR
jgi:hypothetical protein